MFSVCNQLMKLGCKWDSSLRPSENLYANAVRSARKIHYKIKFVVKFNENEICLNDKILTSVSTHENDYDTNMFS